MGLHLGAEAEGEAAARQLLDRPGAERGDGRTAGKGDGDGGADLQLLRRLCGKRHDDERIVLGFLDNQAVVADLFQQACVRADTVEIEGHFRGAKTRIDLAEGQKSF